MNNKLNLNKGKKKYIISFFSPAIQIRESFQHLVDITGEISA